MNGCLSGMASDGMFRVVNSTTPPCDVSIALVAVLWSFISLARGTVALAHWRAWRRKEELKRAHLAGKTRRRQIPVVPILSTFAFILVLLFCGLSLGNRVNYENGLSGFLLCLVFTPLIIMTYFFVFRVVRLGLRIAHFGNSPTNAQNNGLQIFDSVLRALLKVYFLATILFFCSFTTAIFVERTLFMALGFGFIGIINTIGMICMIWQFQRIILQIEKSRF